MKYVHQMVKEIVAQLRTMSLFLLKLNYCKTRVSGFPCYLRLKMFLKDTYAHLSQS
jgi:hypothetical protein